ncbi:Condensin complex subunit 3 [Elsinoe australis]|uniref:Condensin complex subunit 3 n=1 Tax=Elsinoe australis TaxID=40998 RepID=A0A2P7Z393_9PEZI|nr:Condensin complex subunit 3 [Elsinoe australis]
MPGRVSARASRTSTAGQAQPARKSSTQTLKSTRSSADNRASSSPVADIPDEGAVTSLRKHISAVFADSQKSTTGHRKLVINLRKIQEACCYEPTSSKGQQETSFDEEDFSNELIRRVLRLLPIRKSEPSGDRVVRFLGVFLRVASDKDNALLSDRDADEGDTTTLPETPTSRLSTALFSALLPFFTTKDKIVRFRATQIASHMINILDTLDDQLYHVLRLALLKRIHDKEASVRMHAIYGLTRLAADVDASNGENSDSDDDDDDDSAAGVLEKLLILLQNDPSAEVRRSLLLNLPLVPKTLPYLLERARDQDAATRRALFARLLPALGDFRHLSLTHREKLLRWGLRDRDEAVRKATAKLFRERWIEDCAKLPGAGGEEEDGNKGEKEAAMPCLDALLELLERIDVTNSAANGVALEAMSEFWAGRPDYVSFVTFDEGFWAELTPESVFVVRTFNEYCRGGEGRDAREQGRLMEVLEGKMPEVTRFGFLLEREIKTLIETVKRAASGGPDGDGDEEAEEESVAREFVVEQMLAMANTFDYSDEVGRRKMFGLLRDAIAMPELPEEATKLVAEVLRLVCGDDNQGKGEREYCGVILEAIAEVHDTIMGDDEKEKSEDGDESFHSARSEVSAGSSKGRKKAQQDADGDMSMGDPMDEEKAIREIMVNMKCLHIAQCMLQNVQCDLEANVHLVTMLNNLVVPAVRSQEAPIRERGLICLGLCCLLGKNLAQENLTLFLHCFAKGHPELQSIALQIITDILTTHPSLLAPFPADPDNTTTSLTPEPSPLLKPVLKAFSKALKSESPEVQSTGATALSKLMLSQLITDTDILKQLIITFFDPETAANAQLRQALAYFLPVYCHSRYESAARVVQVSTGVIYRLGALREAFVEDEDAEPGEMVTTGFVGGLLVDWTDPRKIVSGREQGFMLGREGGEEESRVSTHLLMAEQLLERMVSGQTSKEERKVLFSMLGKLHLAEKGQAVENVKAVLELVAEVTEGKLAGDATSRNVLTKLQTVLLKLVHDAAGAERGVEDTGLDVTSVTATPARRTKGRKSDETEMDEVTQQLQRELEATKIEEEDEGEESKLTVIGEGKEDESVIDASIDTSQLPDEKDMQSLMDSLEDEDEEL